MTLWQILILWFVVAPFASCVLGKWIDSNGRAPLFPGSPSPAGVDDGVGLSESPVRLGQATPNP